MKTKRTISMVVIALVAALALSLQTRVRAADLGSATNQREQAAGVSGNAAQDRFSQAGSMSAAELWTDPPLWQPKATDLGGSAPSCLKNNIASRCGHGGYCAPAGSACGGRVCCCPGLICAGVGAGGTCI
jgi:type II secretory pathway pseudopilin PulG